jgi:uncharacterized membrane protein
VTTTLAPAARRARPLRAITSHWLAAFNALLSAFVAGGALVAPLSARLGWPSVADPLYAAYHLACHQWAFRSFFLFGTHIVYAPEQLQEAGVDPYAFQGSPDLGYKMAFCERDLAIYLALLVVGLLYAQRTFTKPLSFRAFGLLSLPMAIDGFTQLFGWRESTWELRVLTGLVFGLGAAWLILPYLQDALRPSAYAAADRRCAPAPSPPG